MHASSSRRQEKKEKPNEHRDRRDAPNTNANTNELPIHGNYSQHHDRRPAHIHGQPAMHIPQPQPPPAVYIPIERPPTPAPSPGPSSSFASFGQQTLGETQPQFPFPGPSFNPNLDQTQTQNPLIRRQHILAFLASLTPQELLFVSQTIAPLLKRDFLRCLPPELALYVLGFVEDPRTLMRAARVSWWWWGVVRDESVWRGMCVKHGFDDWDWRDVEAEADVEWRKRNERRRRRGKGKERQADVREDTLLDESGSNLTSSPLDSHAYTHTRRLSQETKFSFRRHFKNSYIIRMNWRKGGKLLNAHRMPIVSPDTGTVTSLALDSDWVVVGLANSMIKVFSAHTGVLCRTLVGHDSGVWGVCLISRGGRKPDAKPQDDDRDGGAGGGGRRWKKARNGDASNPQDLEPGPEPRVKTDGTHVMPSESLEHLVPPSMQLALGLDLLDGDGDKRSSGSEDEHQDEGEGENDDGTGSSSFSSSSTGVFDENSPSSSPTAAATAGGGGSRQQHRHRHRHQRRRRNAHEDQEDDQEQEDEDTEEEPPRRSRGHRHRHKHGADAHPGPSTSSAGSLTSAPPSSHSNTGHSSQGWGQPNAIIVSGGCDKTVRVWDAKSGQCIYVLHGHTSTIRCIRITQGRPLAVTGSRDATLRVWDVQLGRCLRVLEGHQQSVRCLDVCGNRVVSGSYDSTCRLWDIDTGECLHVLQGHFHQVYSVAFDGTRIASGGLDTTVRIWSAETGQCIALLQGHTALVCELQLSSSSYPSSYTSSSTQTPILATGGSDGRVITFCLSTYKPIHKLIAHDSSVTALQFSSSSSSSSLSSFPPGFSSSSSSDPSTFSSSSPTTLTRTRTLTRTPEWLITGGNDGRVRLFETASGRYVRELSDKSESVWKVGFGREGGAVMCKRGGKTVVEIWSLRGRGAGKEAGVDVGGERRERGVVGAVGEGGDGAGAEAEEGGGHVAI